MKIRTTVTLVAVGIVVSLAWQAKANNPIFFGDPLPGLTSAELIKFNEGKDEFEEVETPEEGLGPVFNGKSCAECHNSPAVGGGSDITEIRFGTTTNGHFDPLTQFGGSLIQSQGIGGVCNITGENVPKEATITAKRRTTPLFGLGLVDAVPDREFLAIAHLQKQFTPETAGRVNVVTDPATGTPAVGKFGWKAQVNSLFAFSGDAYLNEMGITSPNFPNENCPQGNCALLNPTCDVVPELEDDGLAVQAFADFMTGLAPPPRGPKTRQTVAGELVFYKIGCANCHAPVLETGHSPVAALNHVRFHPFSDFLLHDMGSLGDGIGGQGHATGREMRTAPLWGLRKITTFLHDGRADNVTDAILAHDGQGAGARKRFQALTTKDVINLLAFLGSL